MSSLFDIAADLTQYGDSAGRATTRLPASSSHSALGILDETIETIYGARQYRTTSKHLPLSRSMSLTQLPQTRLSESKNVEVLDARLKRLSSFNVEAPPRRIGPAIAVAGLIVPPPPTMPPPPDNPPKQASVDNDPDLNAKRLLREVTDEIEQLAATSTGSAEEEASLIRMLSEKYINTRLNKLPGTPFVLLIRKKVAKKLEQLEQYLSARRKAKSPVTPEDEANNNNSTTASVDEAPDITAKWKCLQKLGPAQREVLQNLLKLPEKQLLKLPRTQLELVQFAKRYNKLLKATPNQLRHLPIEHQNLVRSIQTQQQEMKSIPELR